MAPVPTPVPTRARFDGHDDLMEGDVMDIEDEDEDWDEQEEEGTYGIYYTLISFLVSLWNFYLHRIAYN